MSFWTVFGRGFDSHRLHHCRPVIRGVKLFSTSPRSFSLALMSSMACRCSCESFTVTVLSWCFLRGMTPRPSLLFSVLPPKMLSWLVIIFASGSPQATGQRVTLSALRVTAWVRVGPNLLGQGIVLSANKTARPSPRVFVPSSVVVPALNAFGLFAAGAPGDK